MSEDTYKGESPGKKEARAFFWQWSIENQSIDGCRLVLCSREGGDIRCLKGFGITNVVAAERNTSAYEEATRRFPNADIRFGDIRDVAKSIGSLGTVFLDFCGQISAEVVNTTAAIIDVLRPGSLLGVAVLRGREQDWANVSLNPRLANRLNRHTRRRARVIALRAESRCALMPAEAVLAGWGIGGLNAREHLADVTEAMADKEFSSRLLSNTGLRRSVLLMAYLHARSLRVRPIPSLIVNYHSRTPDGRGVPMVILGYRIVAFDERRKSELIHQGDLVKWGVTIESDPPSLRDLIVSQLAERTADQVADIYNIDVNTVRAWKAHATRGTYDKDAAQ